MSDVFEEARHAAFNLLYWSHGVILAAHTVEGPRHAAGLLESLKKNLPAYRSDIAAAIPQIELVAEGHELCGIRRSSMHQVASDLANEVYREAVNGFLARFLTEPREGDDKKTTEAIFAEHCWTVDSPDGTDRVVSPEFRTYWGVIAAGLSQFTAFDCDAACAAVQQEAARARMLAASNQSDDQADEKNIGKETSKVLHAMRAVANDDDVKRAIEELLLQMTLPDGAVAKSTAQILRDIAGNRKDANALKERFYTLKRKCKTPKR